MALAVANGTLRFSRASAGTTSCPTPKILSNHIDATIELDNIILPIEDSILDVRLPDMTRPILYLLLLLCTALPAKADLVIWTGDPDDPTSLLDPGTGPNSEFNGAIPGTSITYSITFGPAGGTTATNAVNDENTHDYEYYWNREGTNYIKKGDFDITIRFSHPIPVNAFTTLAVDHNFGTSTISVGGGTRRPRTFRSTMASFDPTFSTTFGYVSRTGALIRSGPSGQRHDAMLVGRNTKTMTWLRHQGSNNLSGGGNLDGNILNYGFIQAQLENFGYAFDLPDDQPAVGQPDSNNGSIEILPLGDYPTLFGEAVAADCNLDGVTSSSDLGCVSTVEERDAVLAALNVLPGDLDLDGEIGFSDFLVLSSSYGAATSLYTEGNIDLMSGTDFAGLSHSLGEFWAEYNRRYSRARELWRVVPVFPRYRSVRPKAQVLKLRILPPLACGSFRAGEA